MKSTLDVLLSLQLFSGASTQKIQQVVGKHKFHFLKYTNGEQLITAGDPCANLRFVISGQVRSTIESADSRIRVSQTISAPNVIAPDFFFGRTTTYPCSVKALGAAGVVDIEKSECLKIIESDPVFLFNFLNLLSVDAQQGLQGVMCLTSGDLRKRIAYWILALTQRGGTDIEMECKQRDLYTVFGVPRQSLIAALTDMRLNGAITFSPGLIKVESRDELVKILEE